MQTGREYAIFGRAGLMYGGCFDIVQKVWDAFLLYRYRAVGTMWRWMGRYITKDEFLIDEHVVSDEVADRAGSNVNDVEEPRRLDPRGKAPHESKW